jgi:hypothetical protein
MAELDRLMNSLMNLPAEDAEIIALANQIAPVEDPNVYRDLALTIIDMMRNEGQISLALQALEITLRFNDRNPFHRYELSLDALLRRNAP